MSNQMTKRIEHPLISLTKYLRTRPLRVIGGLAAFIVALTVLASVSVRANDPEATLTMTLEPGRNFVGWVSEPIAVSDVFTQLPAADLIYTWDPNLRRYRTAYPDGGGSLDALEPGMAATINIDGRRSVKWERPLTPAKGMVTLYRGVNWVTWVGRDDWPLDQVARGIGTSLVSIRVGDETWPVPLDDSLEEFPTLSRGDALQVTVSRDLRWLQPTGMLPNVVWAGEPSQSLEDEVNADIQRVVDFFAEKFAVESDFSETTILLFTSIDAAVEHQASGAEPRLHGTPEELRISLTNFSVFVATSWGIYMSACQWQPPCPLQIGDPGMGTLTLAHELFHILQAQLAGRDSHRPVWMSEGSATWAEWQMPTELRGEPHETERQWRLGSVARTSVPLLFVEEWNEPWNYHIGSLAAERLADSSGEDALLEFYRRLHSQAIGAERRWVRQPVWEEAFQEAFGLSVSNFYREFSAWRETLPKPAVRYDYGRNDVTLSGSLRGRNGSPAAGFRVNAEPYQGEASAGLPRRAIVDEKGEFSIDLAPMTRQRIWFTRDGCTLWLTDDGLSTTQPPAGGYRDLDTGNLPRLNLNLPVGACSGANSIEVEVLRLRGDERRVEVGFWFESNYIRAIQADATFSSSPSGSGPYKMIVRIGGCDLWYTPGALVAAREDAAPIELGDSLVSLEVRIPHGLCARQISGRLIDADGGPISRVWLAAFGTGLRKAGATYPDANGEFSITVPSTGGYYLTFRQHGCWIFHTSPTESNGWDDITELHVGEENVNGIEFRVFRDPAEICN